ncbi:hypothetical protein [Paenibacillus ginsengarvi]|uniref:Uncharacterized protein n=1 Tax=Paenibacillus ginsengarvi TaxID=400777 RepID=A0A3B0CVH1_9BACL|nr:hypothetical protein [Paenibacillus ginsengarvi]RKN86777.1 hypothetical protein D7M11_02125 [Paenibacillus ginsengarvi]
MSDIYIACEDMEFVWRQTEINVFKQLWADGSNCLDIAKKLDRDPDEVALLIMDLGRKGLIPRWGKNTGNYPGDIFRENNSGRPKNNEPRKIDRQRLHELYTGSTLSLTGIARQFKTSPDMVKKTIRNERRKNPAMWPYRDAKRNG